jgi:hypothetical protein
LFWKNIVIQVVFLLRITRITRIGWRSKIFYNDHELHELHELAGAARNRLRFHSSQAKRPEVERVKFE